MKRLLPIIGLGLGLSVFLAACGMSGSSTNTGSGGGGIYGSGPATSTTPAPTQTPVATPTPVAVASVTVTQNMSLGPILADSQGRTLYVFLPEKGGKVVCTGACLTYWPLALSKTGASPAGSPGVTGRLGVIDRGGSQQVTYNTWPLYYFAGDSGPDQTKGQGVVGFGGKWVVASPGLQA